MRKLWPALVGAIVLSVAVAGIAIAANTYEVPKEFLGTKPNKKGSAKKPVPIQLKFGYRVGDTENLRPQVVEEYRIASEGLQSYPKARRTCTYEQANRPNSYDPACNKAVVGNGTIHNEAGAPNDRAQKLTCDVRITLINISTGDPRYPSTVKQTKKRGGLAVRIDTYQPEASRCPIPIHEALAAPFYDVKIEGISTAELRFSVPETLKHPSGLDNSVREVTSTVLKKTGRVKIKGKTRKVGYYSAVGRKGRTRTTRVTFIDESGAKATATQKK